MHRLTHAQIDRAITYVRLLDVCVCLTRLVFSVYKFELSKKCNRRYVLLLFFYSNQPTNLLKHFLFLIYSESDSVSASVCVDFIGKGGLDSWLNNSRSNQVLSDSRR